MTESAEKTWKRYYDNGGQEAVRDQLALHLSDYRNVYSDAWKQENMDLEYLRDNDYITPEDYDFYSNPDNKDQFVEQSKAYYERIMPNGVNYTNTESTDETPEVDMDAYQESLKGPGGEVEAINNLEEFKPIDSSNIASGLLNTLQTGSAIATTASNLSNVFINISEFIKMKGYLGSLKGAVLTTKNNVSDIINGKTVLSLFPETKERIDVSFLFADLLREINLLYGRIEEIEHSLSSKINYYTGVDEEKGEKPDDGIIPVPPGKPTYRGVKDPDKEKPDISEQDELLEQPVQEEQEEIKLENEKLISAAIGSFVFQVPITLFTTIGGEQIQSTDQMELGIIGLESVDGVFYYKVVDKKTGKIYYAKCNEFDLGENDNKVIHVKDSALILNSTDIGADDNFVKLADSNSYYLVTDSQEINGVNFATVLDSTDGNSYFIPISDSVEVLSLNELVSGENVDTTTNTTVTDTNTDVVDQTQNTTVGDSNLDIQITDDTSNSTSTETPVSDSTNGDTTMTYSDDDIDLSMVLGDDNSSQVSTASDSQNNVSTDSDVIYSDGNYVPEDSIPMYSDDNIEGGES